MRPRHRASDPVGYRARTDQREWSRLIARFARCSTTGHARSARWRRAARLAASAPKPPLPPREARCQGRRRRAERCLDGETRRATARGSDQRGWSRLIARFARCSTTGVAASPSRVARCSTTGLAEFARCSTTGVAAEWSRLIARFARCSTTGAGSVSTDRVRSLLDHRDSSLAARPPGQFARCARCSTPAHLDHEHAAVAGDRRAGSGSATAIVAMGALLMGMWVLEAVDQVDGQLARSLRHQAAHRRGSCQHLPRAAGCTGAGRT